PEAVPAWKYLWPVVRLVQRRGSPAKAAQNPLWLAASREADGLTGTYLEKRKRHRPDVAADQDNQRRVTQLAQTLTTHAPTARPPAPPHPAPRPTPPPPPGAATTPSPPPPPPTPPPPSRVCPRPRGKKASPSNF